MGESVPVVLMQASGAKTLCIDAAHRAEHAQDQLFGPHLHAEDRNRQALINGHMLGHIESKGGLSHAGATRHDDEIAPVHAGGLLVEVDEPRGHASDIGWIRIVREFIDSQDHVVEQLIEVCGLLSPARTFFSNSKNLGLGLVENLPRLLASGIEGRGGDVVAH